MIENGYTYVKHEGKRNKKWKNKKNKTEALQEE